MRRGTDRRDGGRRGGGWLGETIRGREDNAGRVATTPRLLITERRETRTTMRDRSVDCRCHGQDIAQANKKGDFG